MLRPTCFALATAALAAACNPYDPDLGPTPFKCGNDEPKCPDGYACIEDVCRLEEGGDVDASTSQFQCADDATVEGGTRNDLLERAYITPLSANTQTYALANLAICPGTDKDHFRFEILRTGINFEATVSSLAGRAPLSLKVLNVQGNEITSGTMTNPQVVHAELTNRLAIGQYYIQVASTDGTENNYNLDIKVCDQPLPCP